MYMANASPNARGPKATYIPPARVGLTLGPWGFALGQGSFALGPRVFFLYKHVAIGNAKSRVGGYCPMGTPNVRGFALQWNIGFNVVNVYR